MCQGHETRWTVRIVSRRVWRARSETAKEWFSIVVRDLGERRSASDGTPNASQKKRGERSWSAGFFSSLRDIWPLGKPDALE
jgi:hypothetical protein